MVAVPETVGVHRKTSSGELPELPQLPVCELVPLVVPLKVPPCAGITVGLPQVPGDVTVRLKVPCVPPYPSTTMKYVCPAVTVGVMRDARNRPVELAQATWFH